MTLFPLYHIIELFNANPSNGQYYRKHADDIVSNYILLLKMSQSFWRFSVKHDVLMNQ